MLSCSEGLGSKGGSSSNRIEGHETYGVSARLKAVCFRLILYLFAAKHIGVLVVGPFMTPSLCRQGRGLNGTVQYFEALHHLHHLHHCSCGSHPFWRPAPISQEIFRCCGSCPVFLSSWIKLASLFHWFLCVFCSGACVQGVAYTSRWRVCFTSFMVSFLH